MGIKCFWCEPTWKAQRYLRRYSPYQLDCPITKSWHNAMIPFDVVEEIRSEDGSHVRERGEGTPEPEHACPPWPEACNCGFVFRSNDEWQVFSSSIYRRTDTGEEFTLRDAPVGAMWDAFWMHDWHNGEDGLSIYCKVPQNHDWFIDGPCGNCPWKDGSHSGHKCWVRRGIPPRLTVDKSGNSCPVGAGSIQTPDWHGYLRDGELVTA